MDDFRLIADRLAADINEGRLRPGDRLPPQRRFARDHRIAASTATRVYGELVRRGLAVGEVGRGTFIRAARPLAEPALAEPATAPIDLELNFPLLPGQADLLAKSLSGLVRADALGQSLQPATPAGTPAVREASAKALARGGWAPEPEQILLAGNGRQAIAAAFSALAGVGERIGVEALTYPVVKAIAARLGITLVPIEVDADGMVPDAVRAAHRTSPLRAVYVQPAVQNPLGITMSAERRRALIEVLTELDLPAIEDGVNGFLRADLPPLRALAPEQVMLVDSLSKRLAPGTSLGFLVPPARFADRVGAALRSGGWTALRFAMEVATRCLADGTLARIEAAKREDARARQQLRADCLKEFTVRADPGSYHCWWELPEQWRAETFVGAAARRGIAVSPAAAFTIGAGHAPSAVRLALSCPPVDQLRTALDQLAGLARGTAEDAGIE
ncbi:PLP-dependent aminotransferase family protein [Amycolatopsis sp. 195334CR]|uniref:aminotransferase-like domain-containing protein n=1 Tax=Amycolatopsis sp. 195334CR TaxID=2814588 RepID=UPI001A8D65C3|nr:PLP-dependent aminotransferase family protein [Amycolatopsis sp. 195334CR]MBN6034787.1 PLP-dependent aminotransferase family protein [Amycolatopsis sp. 195334CR]